MSTLQSEISPGLRRAGTRFGYSIALAINAAGLVIVQNILDWGWLPFLTDEFADVVPWISFSLVVSIVLNVIYLFNDTVPVKSTGQILSNLISIFVTYRVLTVFPFDFSESSFDWALVTRILLILAMVGAGIGALTEVIKLAGGGAERRKEVTGDNGI
ncbi:MAG TPA: hypothetical protein VEB69_08105 [Acidimicrobiia bacterium]|nr:hypothetical protein [Acidimicrobiia bacterium]